MKLREIGWKVVVIATAFLYVFERKTRQNSNILVE